MNNDEGTWAQQPSDDQIIPRWEAAHPWLALYRKFLYLVQRQLIALWWYARRAELALYRWQDAIGDELIALNPRDDE